MVDLRPAKLIIILNINELNTSTKKQRFFGLDKKSTQLYRIYNRFILNTMT